MLSPTSMHLEERILAELLDVNEDISEAGGLTLLRTAVISLLPGRQRQSKMSIHLAKRLRATAAEGQFLPVRKGRGTTSRPPSVGCGHTGGRMGSSLRQ
jgi:hypothetical protein